MKDIIIVGAVIMALIASISIFEVAITMFKVANAMDEITTSLKHTDTQISELKYSMSERCRELDLSLIKVGSAVTDFYDSMFDNANVTIIRNDKQCEQHEC